jgi:hypothetical protein
MGVAMAKKTARVKTRKGRPDSVMLAAALERARLKRMIQAKRDISRLANELRRAMDRSDRACRDLAIDIVERQGEAGVDLAIAHVAAAVNRADKQRPDPCAEFPTASTRADAGRQEADVPLAFGGDDVADGARARA